MLLQKSNHPADHLNSSHSSSLVAFWAFCLLLSIGPSCGSQNKKPHRDPSPTAASGFDHQSHDGLSCTECHELSSVLSGEPARAGANDHAPCDRSGCHQDAFMRQPGELCELCHSRVDVTRPGASPLTKYPPTRGPRSNPSQFSHRSHLDRGAMEKAVGFHLGCTDCHLAEADGPLRSPSHSTCARCHAPETALKEAPRLTACTDCHTPESAPAPRQRVLIVGDLRFEHGGHRFDRKGRLISCSTCHEQTAATEGADNHVAPSMRACVDCHDDEQRTPAGKGMPVCETCHASRTSTLGVLAPRSHLPATEIPEDHTLAFRRDHGDDADTRATDCSRCHSFLSGNPRDTCDECHQVMRPRDHVVTWREFDHGPEAATSSDRCTTCHRADFCVSCHSQPPRSHIPLVEFRARGHGTQAVIDYRACVTCHDPARDCTTSGCHTAGASP